MNKCLNVLIAEKSWLKWLFVHCWALTWRNPFSSPSTSGERPHLWLSGAHWDPGLPGSVVLLAHLLSAHNHMRYKVEVIGLASSSIFSFLLTVKCWQKTEAGRWWDSRAAVCYCGACSAPEPMTYQELAAWEQMLPLMFSESLGCIVKLKTNFLSIARRWLASSNEIMSSGTVHLIRTWI